MGLYVNTFVIEIKSPLTHNYLGGGGNTSKVPQKVQAAKLSNFQ